MTTSTADDGGRLPGPRFLTLKDVQAEMQVSPEQAMSLVRRGDLRALQVGGRGQWRIERVEFEAYIQRQYEAAARAIAAGHGPRGAGDE